MEREGQDAVIQSIWKLCQRWRRRLEKFSAILCFWL